MARPRKDQTDTDAPRISVIDRRLKNPFGTPSREIPLKGEKRNWVVRTFSADPEHPNRHYDAVHRLGWQPLTEEDLAVSIESLGYVKSPDGRIVRGEKGHEVLMAMPKEHFEAVQRAKADANLRSLKGAAVKSEVAQATAKEHGDEAGETTYKHFSQQEFVGPVAE
jgi:hypothetical protein